MKGMCIMRIKPINNNQKILNQNFKSKFQPTNSLRTTLRVGQENGNKTLLNTMKKLMNDGEDRLININSYFYRTMYDDIYPEKIYNGTVIDISDAGENYMFKHTEPKKHLNERGQIETEEIEYSIARDVGKLLRELAGTDNIPKDKEIVNMSKKDVIENLKAIEEQIFDKEYKKM